MPATARIERQMIEAELPEPTRAGPRHASGARIKAAATIADLAAEWHAAFAQAEAIDAELCAAQDAANRLYPPAPPGMLTMDRDLLASELAARDHWEEQTAAIDLAFGVPTLDRKLNNAFMVAQRIADKLLALPVTTPAEAALKYGVVLHRTADGQGGVDDPRPLHKFLSDLEHLAQLYRDK